MDLVEVVGGDSDIDYEDDQALPTEKDEDEAAAAAAKVGEEHENSRATSNKTSEVTKTKEVPVTKAKSIARGTQVEQLARAHPERTIQIAGLTRNVNEQHLQEILALFGKVDGVRFSKDRALKLSNGYAWVVLASVSDAEAVRVGMDNGVIDGKQVQVQVDGAVMPADPDTGSAHARGGRIPVVQRKDGRRSAEPVGRQNRQKQQQQQDQVVVAGRGRSASRKLREQQQGVGIAAGGVNGIASRDIAPRQERGPARGAVARRGVGVGGRRELERNQQVVGGRRGRSRDQRGVGGNQARGGGNMRPDGRQLDQRRGDDRREPMRGPQRGGRNSGTIVRASGGGHGRGGDIAPLSARERHEMAGDKKKWGPDISNPKAYIPPQLVQQWRDERRATVGARTRGGPVAVGAIRRARSRNRTTRVRSIRSISRSRSRGRRISGTRSRSLIRRGGGRGEVNDRQQRRGRSRSPSPRRGRSGSVGRRSRRHSRSRSASRSRSISRSRSRGRSLSRSSSSRSSFRSRSSSFESRSSRGSGRSDSGSDSSRSEGRDGRRRTTRRRRRGRRASSSGSNSSTLS